MGSLRKVAVPVLLAFAVFGVFTALADASVGRWFHAGFTLAFSACCLFAFLTRDSWLDE